MGQLPQANPQTRHGPQQAEWTPYPHNAEHLRKTWNGSRPGSFLRTYKGEMYFPPPPPPKKKQGGNWAGKITCEKQPDLHTMSMKDFRGSNKLWQKTLAVASQKMESGTQPYSLRLQRLLWVYCPRHAGVSGNELADRLASTADITPGLQLDRAEVLSGLRNFLNMDRPENHSTDRLKERGVEKGSGRHSILWGQDWFVFNQTNTGSFKDNPGETAEKRGGVCMGLSEMPSWAETETELN